MSVDHIGPSEKLKYQHWPNTGDFTLRYGETVLSGGVEEGDAETLLRRICDRFNEPPVQSGTFNLYLASPKHLAMIVSNIFIAAGLSASTRWQAGLCIGFGLLWLVKHLIISWKQ